MTTKRDTLENASFLNKEGKETKVTSVIDSNVDSWQLRRDGKTISILTHAAIERIAQEAGISLNYDVNESAIEPTYRNDLEHVVRVTIHCNANADDNWSTKASTGCIHSNENTLTITGEANRMNTSHRGRSYLRKMAEKRAFDIAVLKHLGLYSTVLSEEEAQDFEDPKKQKENETVMPGDEEFEQISDEINGFINAETITEVKKVAKKIAQTQSKKEKYSVKQLNYLRKLYHKELAAKSDMF